MDEVIHFHDQFYLLASSSRIDDRRLKDGETFAVFDRYGDILNPVGLGERPGEGRRPIPRPVRP